MKKDIGVFLSGIGKYKVYIIIALVSLITLYSISIFLNHEALFKLNDEDGLIENLTAIAFFLIAIVFLILFIRTKKLINLLFVLIFILGAGEEISWGQRIFGFDTPESLESVNAQKEFNLHNLNAFNSVTDEGRKEGISRYFGIATLYMLFCFFYGLILPPLVQWFGFVRKIVHKIQLPVPPLTIGIFFLLNYLAYKIIGNAVVVDEPLPSFHSIIDETKELLSGIIFLLISISFLFESKNPRQKSETMDISNPG